METEQQAAELGWTPKEQWVEQGNDPDKWRTAEEFMEFGERNAGFVRAKLEKEMDEKLADATQQFNERLARIETASTQAVSAAQERAENERKGLIQRWEAHRNNAAEDDDLAEYNKAQVALQALAGQAPKETSGGPSQESTAFHTRFMPLIGQNEAVGKFADDAAAVIRRDNPNITETEYFRELETRITERFGDEFPQFFGRPAKQPPKVDTSDGDATTSTAKSYADLPPEAKQACDDFVRDKLLTREQYVSSYFGE